MGCYLTFKFKFLISPLPQEALLNAITDLISELSLFEECFKEAVRQKRESSLQPDISDNSALCVNLASLDRLNMILTERVYVQCDEIIL